MAYLYEDEDNAAMCDELLDFNGHNPTVYTSLSEMKYYEQDLPFTDPPEHPDGCWNCSHYDGDRCTKNWNNADPDYYCPDTDDKDPMDWCEDHDTDDSVEWGEFFDDDT